MATPPGRLPRHLCDLVRRNGVGAESAITAFVETLPGGWDDVASLRGEFNESLFHMCFLSGEPNVDLARWLTDSTRCPALFQTAYGEGRYEGENVLHMAIAKRLPRADFAWMIEACPSLVHGRARGGFFQEAPEPSEAASSSLHSSLTIVEGTRSYYCHYFGLHPFRF